jgi:hypothetical protein
VRTPGRFIAGAPIVPRLLITALLVTVLAGCSTPTPEAPATSVPAVPRQHFDKAGDLESAIRAAMLQDKTATTSTTATVDVPGEASKVLPAEGTDGAQGAVSFAADTREVHAYYPVVFDKSDPALVEATVLATDSGYLKPPAAMGFDLPSGKPWAGPFQLAENTKGSRDQQMATLATVVTNAADPTYGFESELYGDSAAIIGVIDGDLDGVPVVKYSVSVDITRAAQRQKNARRKQVLQGHIDQGDTNTDITVWVDAGNHPLRVSSRSGKPTRITTVDIRYRDWGKPVTIGPPPTGETTP